MLSFLPILKLLILSTTNMVCAGAPGDFIHIKNIKIATATDPVVTVDSPSCTIPFTRAGKLILIKAKVDTTEGSFVFDTGAQGLVLNVTYFRSYPTTSVSDEEHNSINGATEFYGHTQVSNFKLGAFNYHLADAELVNLSQIESKRGVKILGLLGVSLFTQCEMIIDYEKNEIHLHYISKKERNSYQHEMITHASKVISLPFDLKDDRIFVKSALMGKELRFVIDYGAESNVLDSRLPEKILDSLVITGRIMLNGVGAKKLEALTGTIQRFALGGMEVSPLPVIVTNLEYTCFGDGQCINGVLGYDFLSRYKLCFNFVKHIVYVIE